MSITPGAPAVPSDPEGSSDPPAQDAIDAGRPIDAGPIGKDAGKHDSGAADASTPLPDASPPPDAASDAQPPGIDRAQCVGTASSTGTVNGVTPTESVGFVLTDPSSGGLRLVLLPDATIRAGDVAIGLYFTPIPGQLTYGLNGTVGCAVLRYTGSSWSVVDKTQLCELHFAVMQHASAPNVCDGTIAGSFRGIFSANAALAGTFVLPSDVAAAQITPPSCRAMNDTCTTHTQCCSQSCSPVLGICQ